MTYLQYYGLAQHDQQDPWLRHCTPVLNSVPFSPIQFSKKMTTNFRQEFLPHSLIGVL